MTLTDSFRRSLPAVYACLLYGAALASLASGAAA